MTPQEQEEKDLAERVRAAFIYNPTTGSIRWKVTRQGGFAIRGAPAGSRDKNGHSRICLDGKNYSAARIAYLYQMGFFPHHRIAYADSNPSNTAWENIRKPAEDMAQTRIAKYHRELRALNKEIDRRIAMAGASARDAAIESDASRRSVRRMYRQQIRDELAQHRQELDDDDEAPAQRPKRFGSPGMGKGE